jgi:hypothetical protein
MGDSGIMQTYNPEETDSRTHPEKDILNQEWYLFG